MSEDLISTLKDTIVSAAIEFGISRHIAGDLALKIEDQFRLRGGGISGYVAKVNRAERRRLVQEDFHGDNLREVALKHGISERHARRMVRDRR